jgi:hypothetical protein
MDYRFQSILCDIIDSDSDSDNDRGRGVIESLVGMDILRFLYVMVDRRALSNNWSIPFAR